MSDGAAELAARIVARAAERGLWVSTAESCTGGLVAAALTDVPGASAVFAQGVVTYADEAKSRLLSVDPALIAEHGAVSEPVARAMAAGAAAASGADVAVSVTGIAGPGGGSPSKPVGLVWFGLATASGVETRKCVFEGGDRATVRQRATEEALGLVLAAL